MTCHHCGTHSDAQKGGMRQQIFLLFFFHIKTAVMACHVITLIWLHKPSVKSLHITQAITQPKMPKLHNKTQVSRLTFWGFGAQMINSWKISEEKLFFGDFSTHEKQKILARAAWFSRIFQVFKAIFWFLWVWNKLRFCNRQSQKRSKNDPNPTFFV